MPLPTPPAPQGQLLPNGTAPYGQQFNFGQLIGQCSFENPDCLTVAGTWINTALKTVLDRRNWFGLMINGQINSPQVYNVGTSVVTNGSPNVTGIGTTWTQALVGRQFRVGYNAPIYTIVAVNSATSLILNFPWGWNSGTFGYFIAAYYYNLGGNIRYVYEMKNLLLGYRMWTNLNQRTLDNTDPWRSQQFSPYGMAPTAPDQSGNYIIELYPVPIINQSFPYSAFVTPPLMVNDLDNPPPFIRGDILAKYGIAQALVWRGPKKNPYYNFERHKQLMGEFNSELDYMARADENLYRQNIEWQSESLPMFNPGGAYFDAVTASPATMGGWGPLGQGWGW